LLQKGIKNIEKAIPADEEWLLKIDLKIFYLS
jgi:hypothetical protein